MVNSDELFFLYYSCRALSSIEHKTLKPTNTILLLLIFIDIIHNPCKPVQHVSIPSRDHHQGHL